MYTNLLHFVASRYTILACDCEFALLVHVSLTFAFSVFYTVMHSPDCSSNIVPERKSRRKFPAKFPTYCRSVLQKA